MQSPGGGLRDPQLVRLPLHRRRRPSVARAFRAQTKRALQGWNCFAPPWRREALLLLSVLLLFVAGSRALATRPAGSRSVVRLIRAPTLVVLHPGVALLTTALRLARLLASRAALVAALVWLARLIGAIFSLRRECDCLGRNRLADRLATRACYPGLDCPSRNSMVCGGQKGASGGCRIICPGYNSPSVRTLQQQRIFSWPVAVAYRTQTEIRVGRRDREDDKTCQVRRDIVSWATGCGRRTPSGVTWSDSLEYGERLTDPRQAIARLPQRRPVL